MRRIACLGLLGLVSALICDAAAADWIVTRDGGRIETKGEWSVEGRRILFTLPNGTLSAMRVSEVDLDASRTATEESKQPKQIEEPVTVAKREPVLVLTNKDIPQAAVDSVASADDAPLSSRPVLRIVGWNTEEFGGGVRVVGRLENATDRPHSGIRLQIELRNEDGEVLATSAATVTRETLIVGGITTFEASFPGYAELPGAPAFVIDSRETRRERDEASRATDSIEAAEEEG